MRPYDFSSPDDPIGRLHPPVAGSEPPAAGSWQPVFSGQADGQTSYRLLAGQFSALWTGTIPRGGYQLQQWKSAIIPPPTPSEPALSAFTLNPARLMAGNPTEATVQLEAPWNAAVPAQVQLAIPVGMAGPATVSIAAGHQVASVPLSTAAGPARRSIVLASLKGKTLTATLDIVSSEPQPLPPEPPPPGPHPSPEPPPAVVRTVDLTGMTQQQVQAAIDLAQPGTGLYLGPGRYVFNGASRSADGQMLDFMGKDGITLYGEGGQTVIDFGGKEGIWLRPSNLTGQGNVIRNLTLMNCRRAVCALDPQRLWVLGVNVTNCGIGYASERTGAFDGAMFEWPVVIEDLNVSGWAGHGIMFHGGETLRRFKLTDTPGNQGSTYSHGLYIQGARNVLIEDGTIDNTSGHAWQIYSDSNTHAANGAENIVMRRLACRNCFYGPVIAANGLYTGITIEDLSVFATVSRESGSFVISATNDNIDGLVMRNLLFDGGAQGLVLQGMGGAIRGMKIYGLDIANHSTGIWVAPPGWENTRIEGSVIAPYRPAGVAMPYRGPSLSGLSIIM